MAREATGAHHHHKPYPKHQIVQEKLKGKLNDVRESVDRIVEKIKQERSKLEKKIEGSHLGEEIVTFLYHNKPRQHAGDTRDGSGMLRIQFFS